MTAATRLPPAKAAAPVTAAKPAVSAASATITSVRSLPQRARKLVRLCDLCGLTWIIPLIYISCRVDVVYQSRSLMRQLGLPALAIGAVLVAWHAVASAVSLNEKQVPTPALVAERLWGFYVAQPLAQSEAKAKYDQEILTMVDGDKELLAQVLADPTYAFKGEELIYDKIWQSLKTVFLGFLIASVLAIPAGIIIGLSRSAYDGFNPVIQILKPISPLAWLPVIYAIVLAVKAQHFDSVGAPFPLPVATFIASVVVGICSLWPTLLNTANGVANVPKDFLNVSRVLNQGFFTRVWRIVLPASLPGIFTGLRLSLSVGWMVLIAAEMLSNSKGIGLFIWEMYNNGSSDSLTVMMVAVLTIGAIGFFLDRVMITLQKAVSHGAAAEVR